MRALPLSRATNTVDANGVAIAVPDGSTTPFIPASQIKVYVSAAAYVGFGSSSSVPVAATTNTVHQEAATEEVYEWPDLTDAQWSYIYIYGNGGTITYRVSFFG